MNGDNVRACPSDGKRTDPQYTEMSLIRREFFTAWRRWIAAAPPQVEVCAEYRATLEVMRQLTELEGS